MRRSCNSPCTSLGIILVLIGCWTSLSVAHRAGERNPSFAVKPRGNFINFFSRMLQKHSEQNLRLRPKLFQSLNHNKDFNHWGQYQRPVQQPDYERHFYNFGAQRDYAYSDEGGDGSSLDFSCQEPSIPQNHPYGETNSENADQDDICNDKDYGIRWKETLPEQANIEIEEVISKGGQSKWSAGKGDSEKQYFSPSPEDKKFIPNFTGGTGLDIHNCFPVVPQERSDEKNDSPSKTTGNEYFVLVIKKDHLLGDAGKLNKTEISIDDIIGVPLQPTNATTIPEASSQNPTTDDANPIVSHSTSGANQQPAKYPTQVPETSTEISTSTTTTTPDEAILDATDGPTKITLFKNPKLQGSNIIPSDNLQPRLHPTQIPTSSKTSASTSRISPDEVVSQSFDETTKISLIEDPIFQAANNPESVLNSFLKDIKSLMNNPTLIVIPKNNSKSSKDVATNSQSTATAPSNGRTTESNTNDFASVESGNLQSIDSVDNKSTTPATMMGPETEPELGATAFGSKSEVTNSVPEETSKFTNTAMTPRINTPTVVNDSSSVVTSPRTISMDSSHLNDSMPKVRTTTPTIKNTTTVPAAKTDTQSKTPATVNDIAAVVANTTPRSLDSRHLNESMAKVGETTPRVKNIVTESAARTTLENDLSSIVASPNLISLGSSHLNDPLEKDDSQSAVLKTDLVTNRVPMINESLAKESNLMSSTANHQIMSATNDPDPSAFGPISGHGMYDLGHTIKGLQDFVQKLISTATPSVNSNLGLSSKGEPYPTSILTTTSKSLVSLQPTKQALANDTANNPKTSHKFTIPRVTPQLNSPKRNFDSNPIVSEKNSRLNNDDAKIEITTPTNAQSLKRDLNSNSAKESEQYPLNNSRPTAMRTKPTVSSSQASSPRPVIRSIPTRGKGHPDVRDDSPSTVRVTNSESTELPKPNTTTKATVIPTADGLKRDRVPNPIVSAKIPRLNGDDSTTEVPTALFQKPGFTVNGGSSSSDEPMITEDDILLGVTIPENNEPTNLASTGVSSLSEPTIVNGSEASDNRTPLYNNPDPVPTALNSQSSDSTTSKPSPAHDLIGSQLTTETTNTETTATFSENPKDKPANPRAFAIDEKGVQSNDNSISATFTASSFTSTNNPVVTSTKEPRPESEDPNIGVLLSSILWMRGKKSAHNSTEDGAELPFDPINASDKRLAMIKKDVPPENLFLGFKNGENDGSFNATTVTELQSTQVLDTSSKFSNLYHSFLEAAGHNTNNASSIVNASSSTASNWSSFMGAIPEIDDGPSKKHTRIKKNKGQNRHTSLVNRSQADSKVTNNTYNKSETGSNNISLTVNDADRTVDSTNWRTKFKGIISENTTTIGLNGIKDDMVSSQSTTLHHNSTASTINEKVDDATMEILITEPPGGWVSLFGGIQDGKDTFISTMNATTQDEAKTNDTSTRRHGYSHFHGSDFEVWSGENDGV